MKFTDRLQVTLSLVLFKRIEKYCRDNGVTKSYLVTIALNEYLSKWGY